MTRLTTPSGKPAASKASTISPWVRGQRSEALKTTVLPQASGVAIARQPRITGAFHGAMPSTTPDRLAQRQRQQAGLVRRDHLAGDLRGQRRGLADHSGAQHHIEARPRLGRAQLLGHRVDERVGARFQLIRGAVQQRRGARWGRARTRPERRRKRLRPRRSASCACAPPLARSAAAPPPPALAAEIFSVSEQ